MIALRLIFWIPYRIGKAFVSTSRLLFNVRVLRALPWRYVARMPRRDIWIAMALAGLVGGIVGCLGAVLLSGGPREVVVWSGLAFLALAIVASWVRAIRVWYGLRHGRRAVI